MESGTSFNKGSGHLILALQGWQSFGETKADLNFWDAQSTHQGSLAGLEKSDCNITNGVSSP